MVPARRWILPIILLSLSHFPGYPAPPGEEIAIKSPDGFLMAGRYHTRGASGPGLMLLHQCNREGPATGYEQLAVLLADRGFNVLELDFRGFGKSRDDRYSEFRSQMDAITPLLPADVEAAYRYLVGRTEVDKETIGLVGASCGASQAIFLAPNHEAIKALVMLSGSLWPGAREGFARIKHLPVLIATSEDDRVTPRLSELFSESEAPESRLWLYKGSLHGTPLFGLDDALEGRIVDWLVLTLKATGGDPRRGAARAPRRAVSRRARDRGARGGLPRVLASRPAGR